MRIIKSSDEVHWERGPAQQERVRPGDPKLSITSTGKLMVIIGGSIYEDKKRPGVFRNLPNEDGHVFTDPVPVRINDSAGNSIDWTEGYLGR